MKKQLRVLYVYPAKMRGVGLDLVVAQQLQALTDSGHYVDFLARGQFAHPNVRNFKLPLTPANLFSSLPSKYYYNLQSRFFSLLGSWLLNRKRHDLVIAWTRSAHRLFTRAKRAGVHSFLNCPAWHYNFPKGNFNAEPERWPVPSSAEFDAEYQLAGTILTASNFARETFLANGLPPEKVVNIQRGADISRFKPAERNDGIFRVVFCGRLCERKGVRQLLEAWKIAALPNAELWFIGQIADEMEPVVAPWRGTNCKFFGFRKDVETLLPQCDVQVLLTEKEGMPKSLVEGAACGLATITTAESGFEIKPGETGFFVQRDEPGEVAEILKRLSADAALRKKMSVASRRFVEEQLTWNAFRDRFLQAIEQQWNIGQLKMES